MVFLQGDATALQLWLKCSLWARPKANNKSRLLVLEGPSSKYLAGSSLVILSAKQRNAMKVKTARCKNPR